jgi:hypothetical protein
MTRSKKLSSLFQSFYESEEARQDPLPVGSLSMTYVSFA